VPSLEQNDASSTRHTIESGRITVGRQDDNDIALPGDMRVSRHHAEVVEQDGGWVLRDLRSRNGTFLNGRRITESGLRGGDHLKIGSSTFVFKLEGDPMATVTDAQASETATGPNLSAREKEVLALLCRGMTDQEIAESMFISLSTVRSHLERIRDKTGCRRRSELTRLAIERGLDR
jgi:DNA-binding CsgD family transcriptional regulator